MKILLIGNYEQNGQTSMSMQRFASVLDRGLSAAGHETRLLLPHAVAGALPASGTAAKWLKYVDEFLVFPRVLKQAVAWADVVHICDHSNAIYARLLEHQSRPYIVTCHDMLAIRSALGDIPCHRTPWTGRQFQSMILRGLRVAARTGHIVCVSEATRHDVLRIAGVPRDRVSQIYNGLNFPFHPLHAPEARRMIEKFGVRGDQHFVLHVGGNNWYKNRVGVLKIFSTLKRLPEARELVLVMAGKPFTSEMRRFVSDAAWREDVFELVHPENEELRALYSCADVMLFPSLKEGFGWPIIEAQACGCPVVTSNRVPMTEIGGDAAIYIDPENVESGAEAIARTIQPRSAPCEKSLHNVERFSTNKMIGGYLALYEMMLQPRPSFANC